jgi:hypothetical protein
MSYKNLTHITLVIGADVPVISLFYFYHDLTMKDFDMSGGLVKELKELIRLKLYRFSVGHNSRKCNKVAHTLAALEGECEVTANSFLDAFVSDCQVGANSIMDVIPSCILNIVTDY